MNPFAVEARIKEYADKVAQEFLAPLSQKVASPDYIAKNAAQILAQSGLDMTDIVAKLAQDENLNPHEVARVCEEANKAVFASLYKSSEDKTFEFKVADANRALGVLNAPYEGPGDLFLPVEHPKLATQKTAAEKTASAKAPPTSWAAQALRPSEAQQLQMQLNEEKEAHEAFKELNYECKAAQNQAALDFLKIARDLVLEGECTPSEIFAMVKEARPGKPTHAKVAQELLALVALHTTTRFPEGAQLVVKYAHDLLSSETGGGEQPADDLRNVTQEEYELFTKGPGTKTEDLISPLSSGGVPVRIINGNHALFLAIDTLVDQTGKENWWGKGLLFSGDRVRSVIRNVVNWKHKTESAEF